MGHYFTNDDSLKSNTKIHDVLLANKYYSFKTDHGVFSKKGLDFGSRLLIETVMKYPYHKLLDLGCGYGPMGIILKSIQPQAVVDMVDINERAIELAKMNAKLNKTDVYPFVSDGFDQVKDQYDIIVTNPPIRAGKAVIYRFFEEAKKHLMPKGYLFIVIQKKQGAPSTLAFCQSIYSSVEVIQKKSGYQIIRCGL
ncbi:MAG: class I SAM-dependent methyltransferase [Candidatus Izemoplasmatales bacterium]